MILFKALIVAGVIYAALSTLTYLVRDYYADYVSKDLDDEGEDSL
jgi:hypothetical protein